MRALFMDNFLAHRVRQRSAQRGEIAPAHSDPKWYEQSRPKFIQKRHTFADKKGETSEKVVAKNLTEGETSDGTDAGVCYSDFERTPGTTEGAKGSCRPKGEKKNKSDD
tara:strand:+ start:2957 stop:3283 length:327 start_codon:yes stop_codon:yes gene_type:complete